MSSNINITSIPTPIESITRYASYNREFQIFIYKECKFYLESSNILAHFTRYHNKLLSKEEILIVKDFIDRNSIKLYKDLDLPLFNRYYFKDLIVFSDYFSCNQCNTYATISYKSLKEYSLKIHPLSLKEKSKNNTLYNSNLYGQMFSKTTSRKLFIIKTKEEEIIDNTKINISLPVSSIDRSLNNENLNAINNVLIDWEQKRQEFFNNNRF